MMFPVAYQEPPSPIICQVREAAAKSAAGILRAAAPELSGPIALGCKRLCLQVTLRVQVPNNHILTQNLYYNYYYPNLKYPNIGYMDP